MWSQRFQIGALIILLSGSVVAKSRVLEVDRPAQASGDGQLIQNHPVRPGDTMSGPMSQLRIVNIRLESAPPTEKSPSSILKFDLLNEGSNRLTDLKLEITITEKPVLGLAAPRRLVGPFTIEGHVVLQAGYTIRYEMLLQDFSSDCKCIAEVAVVSVQTLPSASACSPSSGFNTATGDC
jgi:hypothetical protein